MTRLTDMQKQAIIVCLEQGLSQRATAEACDVPRTTVQYYAKQLEKLDPNRPQKVLVLPDLQVPYHDRRALDAVLNFAADEGGWDQWIQIGDYMDFKYLHKASESNLRILNEGCFAEDYEIGRKVLDDIKSAVGAPGTVLEGNHDYRVTLYLDKNPHFRGTLEVPVGLQLNQKRITWLPTWSKGVNLEIGHALFTHGLYVNQYHASKHARMFGTNVFYGHVHDVQAHSLERLGSNDTIVAQSLGCLCEYDQEYMQGRPSKWQQAFGIFYFMPDGTFTYYVPRIIRGSFVAPNGKIY